MTGLNRRHHDRADQGGSTEARPDQKMGRLRRWPAWFSPYVDEKHSSGVRAVLKRGMNKKRRQRDRRLSKAEEA